MVYLVQVELASLDYKASRLVRSLDAASGQRGGFGEGGLTEVVSARCSPYLQGCRIDQALSDI